MAKKATNKDLAADLLKQAFEKLIAADKLIGKFEPNAVLRQLVVAMTMTIDAVGLLAKDDPHAS